MEQQITTTGAMVRANALQEPDLPFLMFYDDIITYKTLHEKTDAFAAYLLANDIGKGDVVSFMIGNNPGFFYCLLGAQKIGAISCPVSCWWQADEVEFLLNNSKTKVMVIDPEYAAIISAIKDKVPSVQKILINAAPVEGLDFPHDSLEQITHDTIDEISSDYFPNSKDAAALMYTSGTTGTPKGVLLSHKGVIKAAQIKTDTIPIVKGLRCLCVLPQFHTGGLFDLTIPCMYKCATVVLRKNFSATEFWESIEKFKVNAFLVVPTILNILLKTPLADEIDTSSLKFALSGASPIPPEQLEECEQRFNIPFLEAYGATENTGGISVNRIEKRKTGSVGLAFNGIEVKILNTEGEQLAVGETGELAVKGETVMTGYFNDPENTAQTIKNDWLYTGDLGYMDEDGFFFIVDRKKDMIIRGGINVYPKELENIITTHPKVDRVAVIAEPHNKYGQVAKACIVIQRGQSMDKEEIHDFCKEKMAAYKIPDIFIFRESLPTSVLGKVIKKDLIIELEEEASSKPVPVAHFFEGMPDRLIAKKAKDIDATVSYNITGKGGGKWTLHIKDQKMKLTSEILSAPTTYVVAKDSVYHDIATGKLDGLTAVMTGKLKIEGDVGFMATLRGMLTPMQ